MTLKKAITKAIESGWNPFVPQRPFELREITDKGRAVFWNDGFFQESWDLGMIWIDPLFWQSLGKAMGWKRHPIVQKFSKPVAPDRPNFDSAEEWLYHWHRFIDHLAEGKTIEEFFGTLT
jgi:hypothetical protein